MAQTTTIRRPAVFFDRDNTLIVSDGYLGDPAGVVLMDGAADAVARARALGFAVVVVSNQSGVARGLFTVEDVHAVNRRLDELLRAANPNAIIDRHEFCPFHPEATVERYRHDPDLRKPKPGMLLRAAEKLALDLSRSWMIGDAPRDIDAGAAAGCRTILFHHPSIAASRAVSDPGKSKPEQVVSTLSAAIEYIASAREVPANGPAGGPDPAPGAAQAPHHAPDVPQKASPPPAGPRPGATASMPTPLPAESRGPGASGDNGPPRSETILLEILHELRRSREQPHSDFSVSKLLAGIVQIVALAVLFVTYLRQDDQASTLLVAIFLQALTIALLIMGRQR
jgi:D-glycero-D-manno-heptose 1,7-bisphosphate phosphatase